MIGDNLKSVKYEGSYYVLCFTLFLCFYVILYASNVNPILVLINRNGHFRFFSCPFKHFNRYRTHHIISFESTLQSLTHSPVLLSPFHLSFICQIVLNQRGQRSNWVVMGELLPPALCAQRRPLLSGRRSRQQVRRVFLWAEFDHIPAYKISFNSLTPEFQDIFTMSDTWKYVRT